MWTNFKFYKDQDSSLLVGVEGPRAFVSPLRPEFTANVRGLGTSSCHVSDGECRLTLNSIPGL